MADVMTIAASGMRAAVQSLTAVAANIANANSNGPVPATPPTQAVAQAPGSVYQPVVSVQSPVPGGGVTSALQPSLPAYTLAYNPTAPYASVQGMVATPNVDMSGQIIGMMEAADSFRANLAVYRTSSRSFKSLLDTVA